MAKKKQKKGSGEADPEDDDSGSKAPKGGDSSPKGKKGKKEATHKKQKGGKGKTHKKKGAAAEDDSPSAEDKALQQRQRQQQQQQQKKADEQAAKEAEREAQIPHNAAVLVQKFWRSYFLRIRIGIVRSKAFSPEKAGDEAMQKEPLKKKEVVKLWLFILLNLACALATGFVAIYIWVTKIVPNPTEQSNYFIFGVLSIISGTSTFGMVAGHRKYISWLRGYAFIVMIVLCMETSMLIALVVDDPSMGDDSEVLKQQTIANIKSHFCEFHDLYNEYVHDEYNDNSWEGNSWATVNVTAAYDANADVDAPKIASGPAALCNCETVECVNDWALRNFQNAALGFAILGLFQVCLAMIGWSLLSPWSGAPSFVRLARCFVLFPLQGSWDSDRSQLLPLPTCRASGCKKGNNWPPTCSILQVGRRVDQFETRGQFR